MNSHKGKVFSIGGYSIQPYTVELQNKAEMVEDGLFELFSNKLVTRFNQNLQIKSRFDVFDWTWLTISNYETEEVFTYFLIDTEKNKLIGIIPILSNKTVFSLYPMIIELCQDYLDAPKSKIWGIEYYLNPEYWKKGVMSLFVGLITQELFSQGVDTVIALTAIENVASISLLEKCKYSWLHDYQDSQHQELWYKQNNMAKNFIIQK